MADAFAAAGLISILHFDTDWTLNLPYLKDLPRGKCICELDSRTDIFKAKEILKGHMCIMGDVPATLLSLGTEEEVVNYCNKLHEVVGRDGGFILSTGCECPIDAKFENVKAMLETARSHTYPGHNKLEEVSMSELAEAILELKEDEVDRLVREKIEAGVDPLALVDECREGMRLVGERHRTGDYFLGELIMSGEIFKNAMGLHRAAAEGR